MPYLVMGLATGTGAPGADANTRLLVQSDTTNGSTTFTDSSSVGQTITPINALVEHSTDAAKFGATAIKFSGSALQCNSTEFAVGTGDWTYDFWVYRTGSFGTSGLFANGALGGGYGPYIYTSGGGSASFYLGNNGGGQGFGSITVPLNTWTHIAFVRSSGQVAGAMNGTFVQAFTSNTTSLAVQDMAIGGRYSLGTSFPLNNTLIDEFRFSNVARWTTTFTPPTAPYA